MIVTSIRTLFENGASPGAGLVAGTRGPAGGYRLMRPARQITFRQIYEAVEGPMQARACLFGEPVCKKGRCALSSYFGRLNRDDYSLVWWEGAKKR